MATFSDTDEFEGNILTLGTDSEPHEMGVNMDHSVLINGEYYTLQESKSDSSIMTLVLNADQMCDSEATVTNVSEIATNASQFIEKAMGTGVGGIPPDIVIRVESIDSSIGNPLKKAGTSSSKGTLSANGIIETVTSRFINTANFDTTKSSPSSPTFGSAENEDKKIAAGRRQRSYSDSGDQLTPGDRACLEEIERGSQLTPEDRELFEDLSNNKFDFSVSSSGGGTAAVSRLDTGPPGVGVITCDGEQINLRKKIVISKNEVMSRRNLNLMSNNNRSNLSVISVGNPKRSSNTLVKQEAVYLPISALGVDASDMILNSSSVKEETVFLPISALEGGVSGAQNSTDMDTLESVLLHSKIPTTSGVLVDGSKSTVHNVQTGTIHSSQLAPMVTAPVTSGNPVTAAPQTIKQVVVHIGGKEQVFDVPEIDGGQFTVHPISMLAPIAVQQIGTPPGVAPSVGEDTHMMTATDMALFAQDITPVTQEEYMKSVAEKRTTENLYVTEEYMNSVAEKRTAENLFVTGEYMNSVAEKRTAENWPLAMTGDTNTEKPYLCTDCGMTYSKPSKLRLHVMSRHTGERPYKCTYKGCEWAFTAKHKLIRHEECHEKKQNGIKDFTCPVRDCRKKCTTIYNLNTHLKLHSRPCTHECDVCSAKFGTTKDLDKHRKSHGEESRNFNCPHEGCKKMFYSKSTMGSHLLSHKRVNHHPCTFAGCDRVFTQPCKLKNHIRYHTNEKPYECTYQGCSWSFSNQSHLKRHLRTHTNERNYRCPQCDKSFLRPEHLKGHMISHTGERPFACDIPGCTARFTAKSTMYIHKKKHRTVTGTVLMCPIEGCQQAFQMKAAFRKHIDQHYGKEPRREQIAVEVGEMKAELESSGLQFINLNLPMGTGNVNQLLVSPELAQSLLAASAGSMVETGATSSELAKQPITIPTSYHSDSDGSCGPESTSGGSARTDYHSNHLLSVRAKKRRNILKEKAAQAGFDLISVQDIADQSAMAVRFEDSEDGSGPVMNPNEVMTSRAITIRDPETGATYVQTQLLQDDPPNLEFDAQGNLSCVGSTEIALAGVGQMIHDAGAGQIIHDANLAETATHVVYDCGL